MSLRPLLSAALITTASVLLLAPSAQAATPGPTQLTGSQLKSALLPGSSFGSGYKTQDEIDSGNVLESTRAIFHVPTMKCSTFMGGGGFGTLGFGETSVASDSAQPRQGEDAALYQQIVYQFPSTGTSESFYKAIRAKYGKCGPITVPTPGGPGKMTIKTRSVTRTYVDGHQALRVFQSTTFTGDLAGSPALSTYWLFTIDGRDIFIFQSIGGPASPLTGLTVRLIDRVSALR
jgi:hypothetical protein